ncbi:squamous cell carcinoma antigen recognized by T-cells 3-like [Daktulosphaira vitifoliae]|uniref:squamous cell carcinoma antigen recognized by T-cells 3-like n=1 Tax=Daktulosphaira vitifoliae TaxID=58002 RepID=UPI0021AA71D6|nr:squamous cell carcinoma antigen recognized by T-cells 3-like [Daktulosphaira vitifoliae]
MEVDSDSSLSSEDSNDEEYENFKQEELKKKVDVLENRILNNSSDYDAYVELISILREANNLEEVRKARLKLNEKYPLSAKLWLDWIKDEIGIATTEEEKNHVVMLCEKGIKDYLSIDLWLEFVQFSIGCMTDNTGTETTRQLMERALTAGGLHVPNGNVLWEVYIVFEKLILDSLKQNSDEKAIIEQKRRINNLYKRQLSVPLFDMESNFNEYKEWLLSEGLEEDKAIEDSYKRALNKLQQIQVFEDNLLSKEISERLSSYMEYINWEKNPKEGGNKPNRIICLFERAIADLPLEQSLWADYIDYIVTTIKEAETILIICKRSIANCPWSVILWCTYLIQAEVHMCPHEEITAIMEKALCSWFSSAADYRSLYLTYIYYLRRRLNDTDSETKGKRIQDVRSMLENAQKYLIDGYGFEGDPSCELLLWWTDFEAIITGDMERVRKMWNDILSAGHNQSSAYWIKYLNLEMQYGDPKHVRKLFTRALMTNTDSPETIGVEWIKYESLYGDLDSMLNCQEKFKSKMKQVQETREKEQVESRSGTKVKEAKKRKWEEKESKTTTQEENFNGNFKVPYSTKQEKDFEPSPEKKSRIETTLDKGRFVEIEGKEHRSVFVSNLDFAVTESEVKDALSIIGPCEVQLVKDFRNRSKGFGYVLFENTDTAIQALKKDRTLVNNRPMFISKCEPDKQSRTAGLRFTTRLEKNKLFVKGLPFSCTKTDLENIFKEYGTLKDIRIVTFRNGHSKGLAYIDFEDEVSAAAALLKTDNMVIQNKTISVALSQPPDRKNISEYKSYPPPSRFNSSISNSNPFPVRRDTARTKLSLLPSVLQKSIQGTTTQSSKPTGDKSALSNNDFRKMLLNNK